MRARYRVEVVRRHFDKSQRGVQAARLEVGAMQCGYCTTGMIMSCVALLKANPDPSPPEIARSLQGNICRCGTYARIVQAVRQAAVKGGSR